MLTYQDLLAVGENENERAEFVRGLIKEHKSSGLYKNAQIADDYNRKLNTTIRLYQKLLYTVSGQAVPDNYSANFKIPSAFFPRFVTQENQTLLANGVSWDGNNEDKLGKDFDSKLSQIGLSALVCGVAFGFYNLDHVELFPVYAKDAPCFAPLYDEETGALCAGVRFWQLDGNKPLRATLYELDGYTEYIWRQNADGEVLKEKQKYITKRIGDQTDYVEGTLEYIGENYPSFPIVPLWGNPQHQSEIVGLREGIDCYDLIKSGFANTVDEASLIYWTISNAGGMDDEDLVKFVEHMKTVKAAVVDEAGASAESHSIEAPYASREAILDRLEKDLYRDAMAVNTDDIAAGNVTATQIRAAYDALNSKIDQYELCVLDFLQGIMAVAGIDDNPTFTRSQIVNTTEQVQTLMQAAQYLSDDYVTKKLLDLFGDGDLAEDMLKEMDSENASRISELENELESAQNQNDIETQPEGRN